MQNATPMTVTLPDGQHMVLFSATSCEPGKQCSQHNSLCMGSDVKIQGLRFIEKVDPGKKRAVAVQNLLAWLHLPVSPASHTREKDKQALNYSYCAIG